MPKIIENLREQIISEAKKQLCEMGYKRTTVRSVAQGCGIAVGTVYNYFKSKDMLIASFILQDWNECIKAISSHDKKDRRAYLEFIYISLSDFSKAHESLFSDKEALKTFNTVFSERHRMLRCQLSELICPISPDAFTAEFVAEALLCWTMAGRSFEEIYNLLPEIIK